MKKIVLSLVALAVVAAGAWSLGRKAGPVDSAPVAQASAPKVSNGGAAPSSLAPSSVLAIDPKQLNPLAPTRTAAVPPHTLARDFANATQYKPLYDRLKSTPEGQTPEGEYFLYQILKACATVADRKGAAPAKANTARIEERKQDLIATLPETDPKRVQRLAAFDKLSTDKCQGLEGITVAEADLSSLLKSAVAGGDPKARAFQIEQEMYQAMREARSSGAGPGGRGLTLSDAQLDTLKSSLASRDPEAMVIAGRVLANSFRDLTIKVGPDQEAIENRVFANAWQLVACEYGYPCSDNNQRVLNACAYQGHCGVANLNDYLFYYGSSPYDSQLLERYRGIVRQAIDTGDWSQINVQRGVRTPPGR